MFVLSKFVRVGLRLALFCGRSDIYIYSFMFVRMGCGGCVRAFGFKTPLFPPFSPHFPSHLLPLHTNSTPNNRVLVCVHSGVPGMLAQVMGATAALTEQPELMRIIGTDGRTDGRTDAGMFVCEGVAGWLAGWLCVCVWLCVSLSLSLSLYAPLSHTHTILPPPTHTHTDVNIRRNFGADPRPPLFAHPLSWGKEATREVLDAAATRYPDTRWATRRVSRAEQACGWVGGWVGVGGRWGGC